MTPPDRRKAADRRKSGGRRATDLPVADGRRSGDRVRAIKHRVNIQFADIWKRIAVGLIVTIAFLEAVVLVALLVQEQRDHIAVKAAQKASNALQAEAQGLCKAINASDAYVDEAHGVLHHLLTAQGKLQYQTGWELTHGISHGVRRAGRLQLRLGLETLAGAAHVKYLAPINCPQLTADPTRYQEARAQPFGSPGAPK